MITTTDRIIQLAGNEYEHLAALPMAVYLSDVNGVFLKYNEEGRLLFNLAAHPTFRDSITRFYLHPADRQDNLRLLRSTEPGEWLRDTTIDLKIDGQVKHVRDYTKAVRDPERDNETVGALCIMINMSNEDRFHRLFMELPVGIFSFRSRDGLVHANPKFLEMNEYDSYSRKKEAELLGSIQKSLDLSEIDRKLGQEGGIINELHEHLDQDGKYLTAAITAKSILNREGQHIGTEGIVQDVTTESLFQALVSDVPTGLFKIRINHRGEHVLVHCNEHFVRDMGAAAAEDIIGKDVRLFHKSLEDFDQFYEQLLESDRKGQNLTDHIVEICDQDGVLRKYEIHAKLLRNSDGEIVGRVGAERDVTAYWQTKQQLTDLTTDIGKMLHSYSSTLIHSKHTMDAVIRSIGMGDFQEDESGKLVEEPVFEKILGLVKTLDQGIGQVLEINQTTRHLSQKEEDQLRRMLGLISGQLRNKSAVQQLALVRDGSIKIKEMIQGIRGGGFPKELVKRTQRNLDGILRLCNLVTLFRGIETVLEMESMVDNLRGFILKNIKKEEAKRRLDLYDLVIGVARSLEEYASNRNLELRVQIRPLWNIYIDGYKADLIRALQNILHNAIKYSWVRSGDQRAFVKVFANCDHDHISLGFENWGVPITQEEIEQGLIFQVGYRGINSSDRRRPGTGLGLFDAKKVAQKHGGDLTVTSSPGMGNAADDYTSPFVTRVTFQLPRNN